MLPNKFEMPLDLKLKPSRILLIFFYSALSLGIFSISLSLALPLAVRFILFVVLIMYSYSLYQRLSVAEISAIQLTADNNWVLCTGRGEHKSAELYGECIVTYFLVWLNFRAISGEKYHLLLLRDSAEQEQLRILRVRLRLKF